MCERGREYKINDKIQENNMPLSISPHCYDCTGWPNCAFSSADQ